MSETHKFGESFKLYSDGQRDLAKRTGLNVQYTITRANYPTISIEIAPIHEIKARTDWEQKITVQLTRAELTAFCGLMFGLRKQATGSYHGDAKNKSFSAYCNGSSGVAIVIMEKGNQYQHLITPDDRMELAVFAIRRLSEAWKVSPSDAIALLRQLAWMGKNM